jgi:Anaerobic dehydrogenases, typically selenocysteine-containing
VIDPRYSTTAAKAWKWIPVKPGGDLPLAMAMIRWIIENKRYDATFLSAANKAAAPAERLLALDQRYVAREDRARREGQQIRARRGSGASSAERGQPI